VVISFFINDILDFSKIESGKLELETQPFDLRDCIEDSLDLLASKAAEKGLDLAYLIENNTPVTISGDVTRLRQILTNLISNAIKFTEHGEVFVKASAVKKENENVHRKTTTETGGCLSRVPAAFLEPGRNHVHRPGRWVHALSLLRPLHHG